MELGGHPTAHTRSPFKGVNQSPVRSYAYNIATIRVCQGVYAGNLVESCKSQPPATKLHVELADGGL
ncbi:hypothetical protein LCGC14_2062720 [marine sediment metagenome]|uniref:Uncharacterized protein n=1 Tax=marine sediment metagenome TaxID=412755 RepID=A0A0F9HHM0_9ZZZZ